MFEGGNKFKTNDEVYQQVITTRFLQDHEMAVITLGGAFGTTKLMAWMPFKNPDYITLQSDVQNQCKKTFLVPQEKTLEQINWYQKNL
jgi:hypothetical protein